MRKLLAWLWKSAARKRFAVHDLWQPDNNGQYSSLARGAGRLTLPENWAQIDPY